MSEPIRYTGKVEGSVLGSPHWEHPEGEWIKWTDYTRLQAEVQTLRHQAEIARLKADVERLRNAGDEILNGWQSNSGDDVDRFTKAYWLWITAKECKPSV